MTVIYISNNPPLIRQQCSDNYKVAGNNWQQITTDNVHDLQKVAEITLGRIAFGSPNADVFLENETIIMNGLTNNVYTSAYGVRLWNFVVGCTIDIGDYTTYVRTVDVNADNSRMILEVSAFNTETCTPYETQPANYRVMIDLEHMRFVEKYTFAEFVNFPDAEKLVYVPCHDTARVIANFDGQPETNYPNNPNARLFSPDNKMYVTTEPNGIVSLWETNTNNKVIEIAPDTESDFAPQEPQIFAFSPDNRWFILWRGGSGFEIWDMQSHNLHITANSLGHYDFSPDSTLVGLNNQIWNLSDGTVKHDLGDGYFWQFHPANSFFALNFSSRVEIWNIETADVLHIIDQARSIHQIAFSSDRNFMFLRTSKPWSSRKDSYAEIWGIPAA